MAAAPLTGPSPAPPMDAPHPALLDSSAGGRIVLADNLDVLRALPEGSVPLIYVDPPFNTGKRRTLQRLRTVQDEEGDRTGFGGRRYRSEKAGSSSYADAFDDYLGFLRPRLVEARRVLAPEGSFFLHIDPRESHYVKVLLDSIFGRECFQNEIVWAYDYGARSKRRWSAKHDIIFWYTAHRERYTYDFEATGRIPYMAPNLVGPEKAARGKTPTDVWWNTIVPTNGRERTGYPTQKPLAIVERIVRVHSRPGELCLDFFAGSGTLGEAAAKHGRPFLLVDDNPRAVQVMSERLSAFQPLVEGLPSAPRT